MSKHEQMKAYRAAKVERLVATAVSADLDAMVEHGVISVRMRAEVLERWAA